MARQRHHILAGVLWVAASIIVWGAILHGVLFLIFIPLESSLRSNGWLDLVGNTYNIVAISGVVVIPSIVGFLAVGGRLPWTAERASNRRGFAVEQPQPPKP